MNRVWLYFLCMGMVFSLISPFPLPAADPDHEGQWLGRIMTVMKGGNESAGSLGQGRSDGSVPSTFLEAASRSDRQKKQKKEAPKRSVDDQTTGSASVETSPTSSKVEGSPVKASARPTSSAIGSSDPSNARTRRPELVNRQNLQTLVTPSDTLKSVGSFPTGSEGGYKFLRIEVSHSQHYLMLVGESCFGREEVLYRCDVGLGASDFPTPKGDYFVTHIFDDSPFWIPPPNRAWAWGQSPSQRVYGGTMAPLLNKRPIKFKKTASSGSPDLIEGKVKLDDYGYRFHGTNAPRSIRRNQSHGCVRMLPEDARKVASIIKEYVGTVQRKESENGTYVVLRAPVRLTIVR